MILKILYKMNTIANILKIKMLFGSRVIIGKKVSIRGKLYITVAEKAKILIGNGCFFNNNCSINAKESITIGENSIFGENVKIYNHNHIYNMRKLIKNSGYKVEKVYIGNNNWICSNVVI